MYAIRSYYELLPFDATLEDQYDKYAYIRDAYLQHRWFKVHDGNPPYSLPMASDVPSEELAADVMVTESPAPQRSAMAGAEQQP